MKLNLLFVSVSVPSFVTFLNLWPLPVFSVGMSPFVDFLKPFLSTTLTLLYLLENFFPSSLILGFVSGIFCYRFSLFVVSLLVLFLLFFDV